MISRYWQHLRLHLSRFPTTAAIPPPANCWCGGWRGRAGFRFALQCVADALGKWFSAIASRGIAGSIRRIRGR
jgi:hypothetical protein